MSSSTVTRAAAARAVALRPLTVLVALLAVLAAGLSSVALLPASGSAGTFVRWSEPHPVGAESAGTSTSALYTISSYVAGKPVRWNPCQPIHWRFRTAYAPRGAFSVVKAAVAKVSYNTGIRFVFDGYTTATPTSRWLPTSTSNVRPLLIGWTDGSHSDMLRGLPSAVLGVTRTAYFGATMNGTTVAATKAAVIALDRTDRLPLTGSVSWSAVLQHELSHAMGLGHVGNSRELMYPVLQRNVSGLQWGDRLGLHRVGRGAGCISLPF